MLSCFYFCHIPAWSMGSAGAGMWLGGKQAEVLRALAAISQLTQKDSKNEQKLQASRDPVNFVSETTLLLLSDELNLCPSLSYLLLLNEGGETSRSQGTSRQCCTSAHLVQVDEAAEQIELHFCMDRQEGLKDSARNKPCTHHSLCKATVSRVLQKSSLTWSGLPPLGLSRWNMDRLTRPREPPCSRDSMVG